MKNIYKIFVICFLLFSNITVASAFDGMLDSFMTKEAIIGFIVTAIIFIILFSILKKVIILSLAIGLIVIALFFSYQNKNIENITDTTIEFSSEESVQNE